MNNELINLYVTHSLDVYSTGVEEITNDNSLVDNPIHAFRSTSHAVVQKMQNTRVNRLMRVLFDSGSDKTLIRR